MVPWGGGQVAVDQERDATDVDGAVAADGRVRGVSRTGGVFHPLSRSDGDHASPSRQPPAPDKRLHKTQGDSVPPPTSHNDLTTTTPVEGNKLVGVLQR